MICKAYKDENFEIVIQQDDQTGFYSVAFLKNDHQVEFQGRIPDIESALDIYNFYEDKLKGNDMSPWQGVVE